MSTIILTITAFSVLAWVGALVYWFAGSELRRHGHNPIDLDQDANQAEYDALFARMARSHDAARMQ